MDLAKNQKETLTKYVLSFGITFKDNVENWQIFKEEGIMHDETLKDILRTISEKISVEQVMYEILGRYSVLIPVCVIEEYIK